MRVQAESQKAKEVIEAIKFIIRGDALKKHLDGLSLVVRGGVNEEEKLVPPKSVLDHVIKAALHWDFPPKACIRTYITNYFENIFKKNGCIHYQIRTTNGGLENFLNFFLKNRGYIVGLEPSLKSYATYAKHYGLLGSLGRIQKNHLPNELVKFLEDNYQANTVLYQAILCEFSKDQPFGLATAVNESNLSYEFRLMLKKVLRHTLLCLDGRSEGFLNQAKDSKSVLSSIIDFHENKYLDKVLSLFFMSNNGTTTRRSIDVSADRSSSRDCSVELT